MTNTSEKNTSVTFSINTGINLLNSVSTAASE